MDQIRRHSLAASAKGLLSGAATVVAFVTLFVWTLKLLFFLDGRYYMGLHPLVSLAAIGIFFAAGFRWQYRRASREK
jgi:hypothetical protein